jgi:hypothetical protein
MGQEKQNTRVSPPIHAQLHKWICYSSIELSLKPHVFVHISAYQVNDY